MKLTTPATASAPYTDDAPPVSTSICLISSAGIWLRSALLDVLGVAPRDAPGAKRVPLTSTKVRCEPKPRKLTVEVPLELMDVPLLCSATTGGRLLSRASVRTKPVC